jgi:hypothetical protein
MAPTTRRILLIALISIAVLSLGHAARAVLSSVSTKHLERSGSQAVYPVTVELAGLSRAAAYSSAITRISPRGNETAIEHWFADGGNTWREPNEYISAVRLYLSERAREELESVVIRVGERVIRTEHPGESSAWRRLSVDARDLPDDLELYVERDATAFEFEPPQSELPLTVLGPFSRVFNYIGDVRLAMWALLWALLVVVPPAYFRIAGDKSRAILPLFVAMVGVVVVAATAIRFLHPAGSLEAHVEPMALAGGALSIALMVVLAGQWRNPIENRERLATHATHGSSRELVLVTLITAGGLLLRVVDLDSILRVDMFNLSAAFSLHDTGTFSYLRNLDVTRVVAELMGVFGRSVQVAKIPFVLAGTIAIPLTYCLGRFVHRSIGLVAAALVAVSPYHIAVSGYVREYPITLVLVLALALLQFALYRRLSHRRIAFPLVFIPTLAALFVAILAYGKAVNNGTIATAVQSSSLLAVPLLLHYLRHHFPRVLVPAAIAALLVTVVGFAQVHRFGPFSVGLHIRPELFRSYFNPLATSTMQTFSFAAVSTLFIMGLLIAPCAMRKRSPYLDAVCLAFWGTAILFVLKLRAGGADRYLHHVTPFYAVLLAGGMHWMYHAIQSTVAGYRMKWVGAAALVLVLVNPVNAVQGAWNLVPNQNDPRTPTDLSGGNFYEDVIRFMRDNGVDPTSPLIEAATTPDSASILLDRQFTRKKTNRGDNWKDIGEKIYPIRWNLIEDTLDPSSPPILKQYADHSQQAFRNHDSGYLLTDRYHLFPIADFRMADVSFEYLDSTPHPYEPTRGLLLYRWHVEGPRLPDFSSLFVPEEHS